MRESAVALLTAAVAALLVAALAIFVQVGVLQDWGGGLLLTLVAVVVAGLPLWVVYLLTFGSLWAAGLRGPALAVLGALAPALAVGAAFWTAGRGPSAGGFSIWVTAAALGGLAGGLVLSRRR